jgi:class 3 adenylate cyclase
MEAQAPLRKPLALVFCDIAGFTHLMAQEGDLVASAFSANSTSILAVSVENIAA